MNTTNNPFDSLESKLSNIQNSIAELKNSLTLKPQREQKYYPVAEAAIKLGVAQITIYRGVESGKIPGKKVGQRVLIPGSFIDGTGN